MNSSKVVNLKGRLVGPGQPVYIVAEGGLTNWGELDLAKKQVDAAVAAGADAVKFQTQTTEELVSKKVDPAWYERLKYKELPHHEITQLWEYAKSQDIECFFTAHTDVDLDFLDQKLNMPFFKIGSGESVNEEFLRNVGSRRKPVIMSTGLHATLDEILKSIKILNDAGTSDVIVLHCSTVYPTPPPINHLMMIKNLTQATACPVGYSDHTLGWHFPIAAVALGAVMIEKHLSFDKTDERSLDSAVSCEPDELKIMISQIREIEQSFKDPGAKRTAEILAARDWARQSIVAKCDIKRGEQITAEMLALKRPGKGLGADKIPTLVGKTAKRDIDFDELVLIEDVN